MSEHLKYKINDFEVAPPRAIWESVDQELSEYNSFGPVRNKLSGFEAIPPAPVWDRIAEALNNPVREEPPIPYTRRLPVINRRLAVAAILAVLALGTYYFLNNNNHTKGGLSSANIIANPDQPRKQPPDNTTARIAPLLAASPRSSSPDAKKINPPRIIPVSYVEKPLQCSHVDEEANLIADNAIYIKPRRILNAAGEPIQDMTVLNPNNNKYISITAPNGEQTRVSSKLAYAMPYFGDERTDTQSAGGDNNWESLVQKWKSKIMQSAFAPSSYNFLDILELSDMIKE